MKAVKDGTDTEAIKKAGDELSTVAQKVGAEIYKNQSASEPPSSAEATGDKPKKDGPVEGEVVDDKKE